MDSDERRLTLLKLWRDRCLRGRIGHLNRQNTWLHVDLGLTIFNVISSVALLAIAGVTSHDASWSRYIAALSIVAAGTSILQSVLDPKERAKRHRRATSGFLMLFRDLEVIIEAKSGEITEEEFLHIRARRDMLSVKSPSILALRWKRWAISKQIKRLEEALGEGQA